MSNAASVAVPSPLGLPAGSVRGILSLLIVAQFWLLLLLPDSLAERTPIPINLYLLMTLVVLFFVSHGKSISTRDDPSPSPLYLPGGTLRFLILVSAVGLAIYVYVNYPGRLAERLKLDKAQLGLWPTIVGGYVGGFVLGYLFRLMPFRNHWFFQAFMAWIALLSMFLLLAEIVIQAFVMPTLENKLDVDLRAWEAIVTGVTACYFGWRS